MPAHFLVRHHVETRPTLHTVSRATSHKRAEMQRRCRRKTPTLDTWVLI